jgi:NADH-quinone oxidoreductase subunit N
MPIAEVPDLIPAMPEMFLAVAGMALLMLGVFQRADGPAGETRNGALVGNLSVIALLLAMLLLVMVAGGRVLAFGGMFVSDPFAVFFKVLVLVASAMTIVISQGYLKGQGVARFEYGILVVFATVGMMVMISANDLMSLYLGLELQSLCLYVLAAFQRDDARSTEAGLKYFVLGALASGMLLYGASLVYGFSGTTDYEALAKLFEAETHAPTGVVVGLVFMIAGLAFKVSAVPFHMWTPDVYEGAPTPITAFFAVGPKLAAMALFLRVMIGPFGDLFDAWQQVIVFISMASMVLGAFAAINQRNIKRMMAYSAIGHVGYALIGLAVGDEAGVRGVLIYMAIYLFMTLGAFACILCMRQGNRMVEGIDDLAGLAKTHPMVALAFAIFLFSMTGIPPLAGFFGKLYIFLAAIEAELYGLAVIGVLSSVVAAYYYIRVVKVMYFDEPTEALDRPISREIALTLVGTSLVIVLFALYPTPILSGAAAAAQALLTG